MAFESSKTLQDRCVLVVVDEKNRIHSIAFKGNTVATYYDTEVSPRLVLDDCGWRTPTTKNHINYFLRFHKLPFKVFQRDAKWFVQMVSLDENKKLIEPLLWTNGKPFKIEIPRTWRELN